MRGQSFEGDSLLEPAQTKSVAAFWFEELAVTRHCACRLRPASSRRGRRHGPGVRRCARPGSSPASAALAGERRAGLLYALPFDVEARAHGQYVERAPDAAELFSKGTHEATGTFEVGNPFLTKEQAATIEPG